jgi:peroxiredoxin family protein
MSPAPKAATKPAARSVARATPKPAARAVATSVARPRRAASAAPAKVAPVPETPKKLVIICYSGELEKTWATMILASTAGTMMETSVFVTFWGLQTFVKDRKRITGENWMQKMMSFMQRPGVSHRPLSKMNFLGMGPWMMFRLARRYNVAKPKELLEAAQLMGVKFYPCQMTLDMFGLKREDLVEGMEEPVGAAFALHLMSDADASLFI